MHGEARAVLESTGNYWIRIHDMLESKGVDTLLANPRKTTLIAEAKIKSDRLDARTLATLLQGNLVFESYVPPKAKQEDRTLIRHRASLVKMRTEIRNRIHATLAKHELQPDYSDLFGKGGRYGFLALIKKKGGLVPVAGTRSSLLLLVLFWEYFADRVEFLEDGDVRWVG
jgi:transposase